MYSFITKVGIQRLFLMLVVVFPAMVTASTPWQSWPTVGKATLKWGLWVIYDSELRTPNGRYNVGANDVALVIKYQRDIDKDDLLEATDEQWQHLNISAPKRQRWLRELAMIWPDVRKGDRLIFVVNQQKGRFYSDNTVIGEVSDNEMSASFLNIWLSSNTAYPKMRQQLLGK